MEFTVQYIRWRFDHHRPLYLSEVCDMIGDLAFWPVFVLDAIFCSNLNYKHRLAIASFMYLNGASEYTMLDLVMTCNSNRDVQKYLKMVKLFSYWNDSVNGYDRRDRYFSFSIFYNQVTNLNLQSRPSTLIRRWGRDIGLSCFGPSVPDQILDLYRRIELHELQGLSAGFGEWRHPLWVEENRLRVRDFHPDNASN